VSNRLVLLGGGHAHLFVLEGVAGGGFAGCEITLVSPVRSQAYSGMVPGMLAGQYQPRQLSFDLEAIARTAGVKYVGMAATAIRAAAAEVDLSDGTGLGYDVLSVAIGSTAQGAELPGVADRALRLKPIDRALEIIHALDRASRAEADPAVVVVGGGAAGIEIALAARARLRLLAGREAGTVTLLEAAPQLLGGEQPATERAVRRALARNRIFLRMAAQVRSATPETVCLADGTELPARVLIWATGAGSPGLFRTSGLAVDRRGFLLVDERLRSVSDARVFAAGDAASLAGWPDMPKAGVYAVREGPVLRDNLAAACAGADPPRSYTPQHRFLTLLNTGDGRAVLSYPPWAADGRWAMRLKDWIDRGFVRRFQRLESSER
jgi:selenide, water dikinase